jgi:3'-phosphoadenosine 5'-phosphosulfate sulfotransferase (PAPS reductase)/FAD synthetase
MAHYEQIGKIPDSVIELLRAQKRVTLGFSGGKDSLACALLLRELDVPFTPFYFYIAPSLAFVEKSLTYYERFFDMRVVRLPHPMMYDFLRHQDFQPPDSVVDLAGVEWPKASFERICDKYMQHTTGEMGFYDVVGMRACESLNRRMVFRKIGHVDDSRRKIYPIAEWAPRDVLAYIDACGCKLSDDYKIWNRSYDGLKYQFLFGVRDHYPGDWQLLKEYFPLLELELYRYEQNCKYFDGQIVV